MRRTVAGTEEQHVMDLAVRPLAGDDLPAVSRMAQASEWVSLHCTLAELPRLLATQPAFGLFDERDALRAFMLATSVVPPCAWLGGFGVTWHDRRRAPALFDLLWPAWRQAVASEGAETAYFSGIDVQHDWLRPALIALGWQPYSLLRSYDKIGTASPTAGNQQVTVRPFDPARGDLDAVLAIEQTAFAPPWRHDAREFLEIAQDYPFFVVAEAPLPVPPLASRVVGYQFSQTEGLYGFLVRIAVHPLAGSQGIGARLMAEAMDYFAREGVLTILLNTEDDNAHAQRLYEWFGFTLVEPRGFALSRDLRESA
jgi:ribosomal-protein-alanine N-acetyltransferase